MSGFYKTANSFRQYQVKNKNGKFDHMCIDKGRIYFGDSSVSAKEIFKLYSKHKKHIALVPFCQKKTKLLFDIDSLNGLKYEFVKSIIDKLVHKLFETSKSSKNESIYMCLAEKNESFEKYHIRYPNIIISIKTLKIICKSLNEYFDKNIIDYNCYTLRYPGFDKFDKKTKSWIPNTSYYPVDGSPLTLNYFKKCNLCSDHLKITPLKIRERDIKSVLLFNNNTNKKIKTDKQQIAYSETKQLVTTQMILDTINNDKSLLLDVNAIIIGIKKDDDDMIEIKYNEYNKLIPNTYNINDIIYIAMDVETLRSKDKRKLMLYDIRSGIDRLKCSGNTKPHHLWINVRNKYVAIDTNNNNDDNDEKKEEKRNDDKEIKIFYDNKIMPTSKELELKNEFYSIIRDCIIELNKEKEFNSSKWDIMKFGSFAMDIYTKTSDVDIAIYIQNIDIPSKYIQKLILESLTKLIKQKKSIQNIKIIKLLKSAHPIITVKHEIWGDIDIRIGNKYIKETQDIIIKLINKYEKFGYKIKKLIIFIKYWSKKCGINNGSKGYLNSFGFTMMIIKYIQSMIQKNNYKYNNKLNLYEIIGGFFSFYIIKFDNNKHRISINIDGDGYDEQLFEIKTMNKCVLQIVNPSNINDNIARMVQSIQYDKMKKQFIRANAICKDYIIKNKSDSLLLLLTG